MYWKKILSLVTGMALVALVAGTVWAATYSDWVTGNINLSKSAYEPAVDNMKFVQKRLINIGDTAFANYATGVTDDDVVRCLNIPDDTILTSVGIYVVTGPAASSSGVSATLGFGDDPDGICSELDFTAGGTSVWYVRGNSTVLAALKTGADFNTSGVSPIFSADTIDLTFLLDKAGSTSGCTPVFWIWAEGFKRPEQ
jgi:hypothetical protein